MRTITIVREAGYYAMLRALTIVVDGESVGQINRKETSNIQIPDDARELRGKMDWGSTEPILLDNVKDGDTIVFTPYFTFNMFKNIGIMTLPIKVRLV